MSLPLAAFSAASARSRACWALCLPSCAARSTSPIRVSFWLTRCWVFSISLDRLSAFWLTSPTSRLTYFFVAQPLPARATRAPIPTFRMTFSLMRSSAETPRGRLFTRHACRFGAMTSGRAPSPRRRGRAPRREAPSMPAGEALQLFTRLGQACPGRHVKRVHAFGPHADPHALRPLPRGAQRAQRLCAHRDREQHAVAQGLAQHQAALAAVGERGLRDLDILGPEAQPARGAPPQRYARSARAQ